MTLFPANDDEQAGLDKARRISAENADEAFFA